MGSFYLGVAILLAVAAAIVGAVIYSVGVWPALAVFGLTGLMTGAIYLGINLIYGY
ncbi:hypothetical protein [Shinella sumterensis]|uniref:hypothetical protein n=1 Tax=Shinella sumterensis TaxID=1967501 RepID=UPI001431D8A0|nr:hypothetical protein [Shinella sumterensis]MCD1264028.1 hypothetical protein [Shinella sumterensis]